MDWQGLAIWIALGALAPGALSAGVLLALGRLWPGASRTRLAVAWVLAIGLAYVMGFVAAEGAGKLLPTETSGWMAVAFIPTGVLVLALAALLRAPRWLTTVCGLALAGFLVWLMVPPGPRAGWTGWEALAWYAGLGLAAAASAGSIAGQARRAPGSWFVLAMTGLAAGLGGTLYFSSSFSVGARGLSLAAALAGGFIASRFLAVRVGQAGGMALAALAMAGLVMEAYFAISSSLNIPDAEFSHWEWIKTLFAENPPVTALLLLACSFWTGWIVELPPMLRLRPAVRGVLRVVLMAVPAAVACALAAWAFRQSMGEYG